MKYNNQGRRISKASMMWAIVIAGMLGQFTVALPTVQANESVIPLSVWKDWKFLGGLNIDAPLQPGDVVKVRFLSPTNEELYAFSITVVEGDKGSRAWAMRLLDQIKKANVGVVSGNPNANHGGLENDGWGVATRYFYAVTPGMYSRAISEVHPVKGGVTTQPEDDAGSMIFDAPSIVKKDESFSYQVGGGGGTENRTVLVGVFDNATGERVAFNQPQVSATYAPRFDLHVADNWTGPLTMIATVNVWSKPEKSFMKVQTIQLKDAATYDHVFPQGFESYRAGTKVFQSKDQNIYECKPFPYSGYCTQWSPGNIQFEPGIGSNWQEAWLLK